MEESEIDFNDYKMNDVNCDLCGATMGCSSESTDFSSYLCESCVEKIEEKYKKEHPEEYDDE